MIHIQQTVCQTHLILHLIATNLTIKRPSRKTMIYNEISEAIRYRTKKKLKNFYLELSLSEKKIVNKIFQQDFCWMLYH